jgi:hypothetical protein
MNVAYLIDTDWAIDYLNDRELVVYYSQPVIANPELEICNSIVWIT